MLDMGFLPDIKRILRKLPRDRQTIMCSATFPAEIARLSEEMLNEPERIAVGAVAKPVDKVRQLLYPVHHGQKMGILLQILEEKQDEISSALIFCRTKGRTENLARALHRRGIPVTAIHGDRSQRQREAALKGFREGKYRILVATDVAARGLDIDNISHVINYDIPPTAEDYLHRIGRTARAETEGDAITFVSPEEHGPLRVIESALGKNIPRAEYEGAPPVLSLFRVPTTEKRTNGSRRPRATRRAAHPLLRR
jgi:ATP-dependent RNA helicase RhlE